MLARLLYFGALISLFPALVTAHGVGQRIDLPIPLDLYIVGGAAVVAFSFLAIWFLPPKFLLRFKDYPRLQLNFLKVVISRPFLSVLRVLVLGFFVLAVTAGLFGVNSSALNILPTTVWIMFSVGVTFFTALFGNIWKVINPIVTLFDLLHQKSIKIFEWRTSWSIWPAVAAFLLFRWIENIYVAAAEPRVLAWLVLVYTMYSLIGMALFGKSVWLKNADPFSIFFSFISRFAIVGSSHSEGKTTLHLRPPAVGFLQGTPTIAEALFVLLMISGVTADGFFDTPLMAKVIEWGTSIGISVMVTKTFGLVFLFGVFSVLYFGLSKLVTKLVSAGTGTIDFARSFVFSLLPIAVAYEFAHFASLLLLEGQRFIALLSDPFGVGWDIFGTAQLTINYAAINFKILWNIQVFTIVLGHVIAVFVAHALAEEFFEDRDHVLMSQYPMLIVMLFYTMFSLWIIAQPVIA